MCKKRWKVVEFGLWNGSAHENVFVSSVKGNMTGSRHLMVWYLDAEDHGQKPQGTDCLRDSKNSGNKNPKSTTWDRPIKKQATWLVEFQPYRVERSRSMASMWKLGNIHRRVLSHFSLVSNSQAPSLGFPDADTNWTCTISRRSSWLRNKTHVSRGSWIVGGFFLLSHRKKPRHSWFSK